MINCGDTRVWRTSKIEIFWKMHEVFLFSNPVTIYRNWNQSHSTHTHQRPLHQRGSPNNSDFQLATVLVTMVTYCLQYENFSHDSDNNSVLSIFWVQESYYVEISSCAFAWVQESVYVKYPHVLFLESRNHFTWNIFSPTRSVSDLDRPFTNTIPFPDP